MSSCLSIFVGRQSAGTATRAMPAREPAFICKIVRAPRREREAVHTHTRPPPRLALHKRRVCTPPQPRISASKTRRGKRSWRRRKTHTTMSRQRAAWSCPAWARAAGRAETCAIDRCKQHSPVERSRFACKRAGSPVAAAVRPPRLAARHPAIAWDERPAEEIERPGVLPAPPASCTCQR